MAVPVCELGLVLMEAFLLVLSVLLILAGLAGSVLPALPGPPLAYAGVCVAHFFTDIHYGTAFLLITLFVTLLITVLDYFLPGLIVKWGRGSKAAVTGANIGILVGVFFGPLGLLLGPFVGAFIGEMTQGTPVRRALQPAFFAFMGFVGGVLVKVAFCLYLFIDLLIRIF